MVLGIPTMITQSIELRPIEALIPYQGNARTHSRAQIKQIAASIIAFGFVNPILVDAQDQVIAGHGRLTQRRRGVETKLISGNTVPRQDPTLQKNLARAHTWAKALRSGQSLAQIAASEGRSESAIRNRLTLAFLAPQIQRAIINGTLGPQWSTDAILRLNLSADWAQQIKALGL